MGCECGSYWVIVCPHCHEYTGQPWVSVKDRLPELYTDVLCFDGDISIGYFSGNEWTIIETEWPGIVEYANVIYWMPLPKPPKE